MKKVLFVCSQNRLRSPTAEKIYKNTLNLIVKSAGLDNDSKRAVNNELIEWADIIFVMEKSHRNKLLKKYRYVSKGKRVICLNIPDEYDYNDPYLRRLIKARVNPYLKRYS